MSFRSFRSLGSFRSPTIALAGLASVPTCGGVAYAGEAFSTASSPSSSPAPAPPPPRTNNWNQWDDDGRDGVMQGATKLALGADYAFVGSSEHTVRLALELEHLLRDRWGIVANVALPIQGAWIAPASLGVRFHFVPKFPLDPFIGVGGGVAWVAPDTLGGAASPLAQARAGVAFYYFGLFYVQVEGGYDFVQYARGGTEIDLSGASFAGRLGVYF